MSSLTSLNKKEEFESGVYLALFLKDDVTKSLPIGAFNVKINNLPDCDVVTKKNGFFLLKSKDLAEKLDFNKENRIKITSDFYHDCEIKIRPDLTIEDKLGIHKLKKISKTSFVKLDRTVENKSTLSLLDDSGKLVSEITTKQLLGETESVWIAIENATNNDPTQFNLTVLKFDDKVTDRDVIEASEGKNPEVEPEKIENIKTAVASDDDDHYEKKVEENSILKMKKKDDGRPANTQRSFVLEHNKIDIQKSQVRVIDSLHLIPLPYYPFTSAVRLLFGVFIPKETSPTTFYTITSNELNYGTTTTKDGQFVFFIDDEMVNRAQILNKKTNKYEITLTVNKITSTNQEKHIDSVIEKTFSIQPDFRIYNIGVISEVSP